MEISDIRRENLRRLMNEMFDGKQVKIANALDKTPNYISRCLSMTMAAEHRKNIGEDFAREIEEKLGQPRYALDSPLGAQDSGEAFQPSEATKLGHVADKADSLAALASPRSKQVLSRIIKAAEDGRLTDEDLNLLDQIAARFESKPSAAKQAVGNHTRLRERLKDDDRDT